jgi:hypothetical protein
LPGVKAKMQTIRNSGVESMASATRSVNKRLDPFGLKEFGFEGIVAKRKDSLYESGKRTGAWVKHRGQPGTGICYRWLHSRKSV